VRAIRAAERSLSGASGFTRDGDDRLGAAPYGQPYVGFEPSRRE
jgi:hypothetical protein